MAWYDWDFRPYVTVAERKAFAARELATLAKKRGRKPEPIPAQRRRALVTTFWGKAWCDNLERYADFANRLPRGRTYARNGSVVDLVIAKGRVEARVAGSELYTVTIGITPMANARWRRVVSRCTGRIGSLVALLRGELSADVMAVLARPKDGLFPEPREMTFDCSCPDWADMCKHVAAVLYGVGIRLDAKPALFFTLRDVDEAALLGSATTVALPRTRNGAKRIAADRLADVFGIDLETDPTFDSAESSRIMRPPFGQPNDPDRGGAHASIPHRPVRLPRGARHRPRPARGGAGAPARRSPPHRGP
jgi:uncharacterized Zn finger protein